MVVDFRYTIQAKEQVFPGIEVIQYDKSMNDLLNTLCQNDGVNKLGIEGEDVTFSAYNNINDSLSYVKSFHDLQKQLNSVRMIKDECEIEIIQKAVDISDKVFNEILPFMKPGVKEYDIANEMEYRMKIRRSRPII